MYNYSKHTKPEVDITYGNYLFKRSEEKAIQHTTSFPDFKSLS